MIHDIVDKLISLEHQVEQGNIKPSHAYAQLYQLEQSIKSVKESIKDRAIEEVADYAKGDEPVIDGYRLTLVYTTRYSYKHDPSWERIQAELKQREQLMKKAAAYQQKHGHALVHEGEIISPAEPKTTSTIKMEKA